MIKDVVNQLSAALTPLGFKRVGGLLRKDRGAVVESVGVQKNRFDQRFRINVMIVLTNPFDVTDQEVALFAHLRQDGVHFGAPDTIWWDERSLSSVGELLVSAVVPWLEAHSELKFLHALFQEALHSRRGPGEILEGGGSSLRSAPSVYLRYLAFIAVHLGDFAEAKKFCEQWLLQCDGEEASRFWKVLLRKTEPIQ